MLWDEKNDSHHNTLGASCTCILLIGSKFYSPENLAVIKFVNETELNEVHWIQTSFIIFSVIALIEARGGRGGGRGGRFSSRSRSGYRSSSRTRYVSKFSGSRISSKSQLRTAILLGTVYGATRWKSRSSYRRSGECKSSIISHGSDVNFIVLFSNWYI